MFPPEPGAVPDGGWPVRTPPLVHSGGGADGCGVLPPGKVPAIGSPRTRSDPSHFTPDIPRLASRSTGGRRRSRPLRTPRSRGRTRARRGNSLGRASPVGDGPTGLRPSSPTKSSERRGRRTSGDVGGQETESAGSTTVGGGSTGRVATPPRGDPCHRPRLPPATCRPGGAPPAPSPGPISRKTPGRGPTHRGAARESGGVAIRPGKVGGIGMSSYAGFGTFPGRCRTGA